MTPPNQRKKEINEAFMKACEATQDGTVKKELKIKICILHRYPSDQIKTTNAAFPYLLQEGVEVKTFKTFNRLNDKAKLLKSIWWIFYAPFLVIGRGYDVIYCDDSFPFYPALVKLVCPKSKVVIRLGDLHLLYYCSGWIYKFLHFFEKIEWRMVDRILAISGSMADLITTELNIPVEVVYDPVDPKDFPPSYQTHYPKRVMFHGLLTRNKNVDVLLEAAIRLPDIDFWIVGDGPDRARLEQKAPSNVRFLGWVSYESIHLYIDECDIGVALRSDNPGNELVVTSPFLQYSVMGKPCIVTRRKVFGDYLWQFSTVKELVGDIELLLIFPEEGERTKKYVLENHEASKIAQQIWDILCEDDIMKHCLVFTTSKPKE